MIKYICDECGCEDALAHNPTFQRDSKIISATVEDIKRLATGHVLFSPSHLCKKCLISIIEENM